MTANNGMEFEGNADDSDLGSEESDQTDLVPPKRKPPTPCIPLYQLNFIPNQCMAVNPLNFIYATSLNSFSHEWSLSTYPHSSTLTRGKEI